jgi:hypothetical protein
MALETLPPGTIGAESSRTTGASSYAPLGETQQQRWHQLAHRDAAIVGTENITQDEHFETGHITRNSMKNMERALLSESIHLSGDDSQLTL